MFRDTISLPNAERDKWREMSELTPAGVGVVLCLAALLPPLFTAAGYTYPILICCLIMLYIISVSGLDLVFGYSGQISLGHAAFYALGGYGSGLLVNFLHIPVFFSMFIATAIVSAIGALLAWPASKLVFHFLSLATVAFGEIVYQLVTHSPYKATGDFIGMRSEFVNILGFELNTNTRFYYFALVCTLAFLLGKSHLVHSRIGRAFIAIRENTHAADGMGINVHKFKILAFTVSAFYTAFSGAMYMHLVRYISPDASTQRQSVLFLTMLLFGGTGTLLGPITGVLSVMILTEMLRSLQDYQMFIYGALMLLVIVALPGGLYGAMRDIWRHFLSAAGDGKAT